VVATGARGALPDPAAEQGGLGAGAAWIKTPAGCHYPRAVTILDWPHVARAGHEAIRAARRPAPGTDAPKALEGALTALREQRAWRGASQAWRATGYPIGSGLVERAGALVITRRMQRQGLRWKRGAAGVPPPSPRSCGNPAPQGCGADRRRLEAPGAGGHRGWRAECGRHPHARSMATRRPARVPGAPRGGGGGAPTGRARVPRPRQRHGQPGGHPGRRGAWGAALRQPQGALPRHAAALVGGCPHQHHADCWRSAGPTHCPTITGTFRPGLRTDVPC
jgi:hypothetical protein